MLKISQLVKPYRVRDGKDFRLADFDPADHGGRVKKEDASERLQSDIERMAQLQDVLYAQNVWGVLLIFQAMDAAGKDGAIKHVMSGVNPQGVQVYSFKAPSVEELDHDYMWRTNQRLPERGRIGIFNRSYYEEVLVARVHPELLQRQRLPSTLVSSQIWDERFEDINSFERYLSRNGFVILKFFLNVSKEEQKRRFLRRLDDSQRNWKFSAADIQEREHWDEYMDAYERMIRHTATEHAPWHVVPADHKWYTRLVVAATIVDRLEHLDLHYPQLDSTQRAELDRARALLNGKKSSPRSRRAR
jgi:PPK2 family polyphosphate:nucleotide phosphotransferase